MPGRTSIKKTNSTKASAKKTKSVVSKKSKVSKKSPVKAKAVKKAVKPKKAAASKVNEHNAIDRLFFIKKEKNEQAAAKHKAEQGQKELDKIDEHDIAAAKKLAHEPAHTYQELGLVTLEDVAEAKKVGAGIADEEPEIEIVEAKAHSYAHNSRKILMWAYVAVVMVFIVIMWGMVTANKFSMMSAEAEAKQLDPANKNKGIKEIWTDLKNTSSFNDQQAADTDKVDDYKE